MPQLQTLALGVLTTILLLGTSYSVLYDTYLDTSNPIHTSRAHPLGGTHYFASKSNWLNVYFIKWAWAWTTVIFFLSWATSPKSLRTRGRVFKWLAETGVWFAFTSWFFGPAILERVIIASGGACVVTLPDGGYATLPHEVCHSSIPVTVASHPDVFMASLALPSEWKGIPRLRMGHDVSGHIFLLTMSILFLTEQLQHSSRLKNWSQLHTVSVLAQTTLIGLWLLAALTTSLYFHVPYEKFTGFVLGLAGFLVSQLIPDDIPVQSIRAHSE
ncbi:hypothetical protein AX16_010648 [Volvariella volvacea WC 439]|nr:hypothetical protein AX16_010648 [Volvariella volvacea WC 439]